VLFRGRTVAVFLLLAIAASVLVTLTVADRWLLANINVVDHSVEAMTENSKGLSKREVGKLDAVFSLIENKYFRDVDRTKVIDGAVSGMMIALDDPFSVYMEKETADHFSESVVGSFSGIGAEVRLLNGMVVVESALKDSPAERAGLMAKDVIISVNGEPLKGLVLGEAVAKIRGPKGTKAKLQVQRSGISEPIQLILVRDDIDYETVYAKMLPGSIGKIEIRQFSMNTGERFAEELKSLEQQGMKALLIDVRDNPGGVLPVVVTIAQNFVPKDKPIVWVEDRKGKREQTVSKGGGKQYPVGVIINGGSASAAEVLAGALNEAAGAVLIGETTYGKGTVQVNYSKPIGDGSSVKMTIAKWLTPDGIWIHEKGIRPDIEMRSPDYYTVAPISKDKTLVADTTGGDIRSMQIMLAALGHEPGRKDGYFSPDTKKALQAFQSVSGLPVTGECDKSTAEKLEEAVIEQRRDEQTDTQLSTAVTTMKERIGAETGAGSKAVRKE
jgi:carboxyl-terminal processing protease